MYVHLRQLGWTFRVTNKTIFVTLIHGVVAVVVWLADATVATHPVGFAANVRLAKKQFELALIVYSCRGDRCRSIVGRARCVDPA